MGRLRMPRAILNLVGADDDASALHIQGEPGQTDNTVFIEPRADTGSYIALGNDGHGWIDAYEDDEDAKVHMTDADGGQAVMSTANGLVISPSNPDSNAITASSGTSKNAGSAWLYLGDLLAHFRIDHKLRVILTPSPAPLLADLEPGTVAISFHDDPPDTKIVFTCRNGANDLVSGEIPLS